MLYSEITEDEDRYDAAALLAVARHMMTGREIDLCERLTDEGSYGVETPKQDRAVLDLLRLQFYAQIANWKDSGVACS